MSRPIVRIGLAQTGWAGNRADTLETLEAAVRKAARRRAQLVVFPELCNSPYFCTRQDPALRQLAEPIPDGPTVRRLSELAAETGVVLVVPLAELDGKNRYNSAAIVDADGRFVGRYRKQHLPHLAGAWERFYFQPGDGGWPVFPTAAGRLGVLICWDRYFPEGWRALTLAGAEIIVNPSASSIPSSDRFARLIQPAAAFTNQLFVATVNRVGLDYADGIVYSGGSYVAAPDGKIVGRLGSAQETLIVRDLDLEQLDTARRDRPLLQGRRPETYGPLTVG